MAEAVYAIEDFPDDDLLWRIEWIGGVGYNTSVPSDPQIEICLAQLPAGETNPLSARSRSSQTKRTVRIAVGLLPYKFTLAHFPGNDGVQTDVVDYDESPGTPANRASGYQLELGCHRLFLRSQGIISPVQ